MATMAIGVGSNPLVAMVTDGGGYTLGRVNSVSPVEVNNSVRDVPGPLEHRK